MERKVSKLLFFFFAIFETIIKSMKLDTSLKGGIYNVKRR